jgi:hypothetical protein
MGALPKNKITSVERGKRRRGNTPSLKKDANKASVPLHKRGLVASFLKLTGLGVAGKSATAKSTKAKTASSSTSVSGTTHLTDNSNAVKNRPSRAVQAVKSTRKTQHKG